jgi:F-type H+-transporting ATPase subunit delta
MRITKQSRRDAKRLYRVCLVNGLLDEDRVRRVVERMVAIERRRSPAIVAHLLRLVRLDRARHRATIESATPLPADLQAVIQAGLERRYGAGLTTEVAQRAELIGGTRIQVGCDVYDDSVRARLDALAKSFDRGADG